MRGVYSANGKISGVTAAKTLLYITAPTNNPVRILSAYVTNASNETNEQLEVVWQAIGTLGTPTATTITPSPHNSGDQAASATVKYNVTASEPTYSSNTTVGYMGFASLNGYAFQPTPDEAPVIKGGATWGLRLLTSPTSLDLVVNVTFEEVG